MVENFKGNLKEMIQDEEEAIAKFNQLISSKNLEISTAEKEKDSMKEQHAANANARDRNESKLGLASPIFFCQIWQNFSTKPSLFSLVNFSGVKKIIDLRQSSDISRSSDKNL